MLSIIKESLLNQFGASLAMLRNCLERAEPADWLAPVGRFPFWHVAYHALFFTDLYLSSGETAFHPPPFHRENYNFLGRQPWPPFTQITADHPYDKDTLSQYLGAARAKARQIITGETEVTLAGASGFSWLPITRLESHLYNLRHIQHHAGQLSAFLRRQHGDAPAWVRSDPI